MAMEYREEHTNMLLFKLGWQYLIARTSDWNQLTKISRRSKQVAAGTVFVPS